MKKISILICCTVVLVGCEAVKTDQHYYTKSIAGVPVHEQDYQLKIAKH
ncbi:NF038215 family lipoprotein [Acinetobacter sp. MD2]|nr:NF038215 family lipoprotein [Acinetobacter sp. MD2]MEB3768000.1 hypothetical protein [Acinetobacter sp. MD2]